LAQPTANYAVPTGIERMIGRLRLDVVLLLLDELNRMHIGLPLQK
jgi:hypothetical protein